MTERTPPPRAWRPGPIFWAALVVILWLGVRTLMRGNSPLIDEEQHQRIIQDFVSGRWRLPDDLPMLPSFHVLAAGLEWAMGPSLFVGRIFSVCMALLGFAAFGFLARRVRASRWPDSFQLYAYHPLLFPLTAMVYTDQTAVTFMVLAFLAHASKRFGWAAVALAMAAVLRQTNLIWVIVLLAWSMDETRSETPMSSRRSKLRAALISTPPLWRYAVVVLAAAVLVGTTGRLTAGAVPLNQPAFNINQYYVLLLFVLFLWAPVFVERAPGDVCALVQWSTKRPAVAAGVGVILAATIAFLFIRYSNPHPWNHVAGLVRNWPLRLMDRFVLARPLLLLICAWSAYQTVRFTLGRSNRVILAAIWGCGLLSLSVLGLVEPRYYVPMLLLADLFNDYEPRHAAWLVRWYQCTSAAACVLSLTGRFW